MENTFDCKFNKKQRLNAYSPDTFYYFCTNSRKMIIIADSGSTKTDWSIVKSPSEVVMVRTQGINPFHQSADKIEEILTCELKPSISDMPESIHFYGSGCTPAMVPVLENILHKVFSKTRKVEVCSDLMAAARALCGREEGVACILGTGANSCLYDGKEIVLNTPPLGYILGDEGSGAYIGKRFFNGIFKGWIPAEIRDKYFAETNLSYTDIIDKVYRQPLANRFLAGTSSFIGDNLHEESLYKLVKDSFKAFFVNNVSQYCKPELPVNFIGGIALTYRIILCDAAKEEGFILGKVERSPMKGLIDFHGNMGHSSAIPAFIH